MRPTFKILPAHFDVVSPMLNASIAEAMHLMYGPILDKWQDTPQDPTSVLLRLLANVVFHFEWIKGVATTSTDHPFNSIPLIFKNDLAEQLKELVTVKPSDVIEEPTGIPPHAEQCFMLQQVLTTSHETLDLLKNQVVDVKQVSKFIF